MLGRDGTVGVRLRSSVFASEVEVVGLIAHEMHEINALREMFADHGTLSGEALIGHVRPDRRGNLHAAASQIEVELKKKVSEGTS